MKLPARIAQRSVAELIRVACVLALSALVLMVYPILFPGPLALVLSMSLGHVVGVAAAAFYVLAILVDLARTSGTGRPPGGGATPSHSATVDPSPSASESASRSRTPSATP